MRKWFIYLWIMFVLAGGLVWWQWPQLSPEVFVCNVGQGDGIVITQGFSQMLIDTGKNNGAMTSCLGGIMPFWDRTIEMIIVSHGDQDHAGGLQKIAQMYKVERVITPEKAQEQVQRMLGETTKVEIGHLGQRWEWGEVRGEVMWPPEMDLMPAKMTDSTNNSSLVLRLEFKDSTSAWFAADTGAEVEEKMIEMNLVKPTTMLKISHHGSKYATTKPFLTILQPRISVISVGKNNYGHPSAEVVDQLIKLGSTIHRTDQEGLIRWKP